MKRVQASKTEGVGLAIPERESDCSGARPSWYPFQISVCDEDAADVDPLPTARHRELPDAPDPPAWQY